MPDESPQSKFTPEQLRTLNIRDFLPLGSTYMGAERGGTSGRAGPGATRGAIGNLIGGTLGLGIGGRLLGPLGALGGAFLGSAGGGYLATRGMIPPEQQAAIEDHAVKTVLSSYGLNKIAVAPGLVSMGVNALKNWGGNVARAGMRASQAGGVVARGAQAAGSGQLGAMGRGALQMGKTFLGSRAGRQAVGVAALGAGGLYGAQRLMGNSPQQPQQPQQAQYQ